MDAPTAHLPPGIRIGDWLLKEHAGGGSFGTVYRAVHADNAALTAAVKIARQPMDPRFRREAALLELLRHPHIPRLLDTGLWHSPQGLPYPFLVMEWVEGATLYDWERVYQRPLTSRQVLQVMAQVARALEAVHAVGGVHRDVKGENVRVSSEGRATLVDFGGCWMENARPLTDGVVGPGTEAYRSPQAHSFRHCFAHDPQAHYVPRRADDIYALGVTVYSLLTGVYPPRGRDPVFRCGEEDSEEPRELRPPSALATGVVPRLEELVLASLSEASEERPSAHRLAVEAREACRELGEEADVPVVRHLAGVREEAPPVPRAAARSPRVPARWRVSARARVAAMVLAGVGVGFLSYRIHQDPRIRVSPPANLDAGTSAKEDRVKLGSAALSPASADWVGPGEKARAVSAKVPGAPLPGQRRAPCEKGFEEIHQGCWGRVPTVEPPCPPGSYEWRESCYLPHMDSERVPTSEEP